LHDNGASTTGPRGKYHVANFNDTLVSG
jgi:hypothetical protein